MSEISETWKLIPGFEYHEISDQGRLRNIKTGKFRKLNIKGGKNRLTVVEHGYKEDVTIDNVILKVFSRPKIGNEHCEHLNGNLLDNRLVNLEWSTKPCGTGNRTSKSSIPIYPDHRSTIKYLFFGTNEISVSEEGLIKTNNGSWRNGSLDKESGYMKVSFPFDRKGNIVHNENGKKVDKYKKLHRLVCEAFHGPPSPGLVCHHKDGNKGNNSPENLEWTTHSGNMSASSKTTQDGKQNKRKVDQYTKDGEFIRTFDSRTEAAKAVGLGGPSAISRSLKKGTFSKGFSWKSHIEY